MSGILVAVGRKTTQLSAAALLMFLTGCASLPGPEALAVNEPGFDISKIETLRIAPACPTDAVCLDL